MIVVMVLFLGYKVGVWIDVDSGVYNVSLLNGYTWVYVSFCQSMVEDPAMFGMLQD